MEPVRYVERLNARYARQGFPPYQWTINDAATITPLQVPLAQARIATLTSGGVSRCAMAAWDPDARNDFRLDAIDADAPHETVLVCSRGEVIGSEPLHARDVAGIVLGLFGAR